MSMIINDEEFNDIFSANLERLHAIGRRPLELRNKTEWTYLSGVCDAFKWINTNKLGETKDES
jgi:hypothetical protein